MLNINPSIFYTRLIWRSGHRGAGAYPSGHQARGGVHPAPVASPSQGHTETNETNNHTRSHSLLRTIYSHQLTYACFWMVGGSQSTRREPTHTQGEHANSTQKSPRWGLNLEHSHCEATVLTTTPPCSPEYKSKYKINLNVISESKYTL